MSFLKEYNLKMICTEEEVTLMPVKDVLTSRARQVDGGGHSFLGKKSGMVSKATKDQMISTQVWRISWERISINTLSERPEEAMRVLKRMPVPFPQEWGNIFPCRGIVR